MPKANVGTPVGSRGPRSGRGDVYEDWCSLGRQASRRHRSCMGTKLSHYSDRLADGLVPRSRDTVGASYHLDEATRVRRMSPPPDVWSSN